MNLLDTAAYLLLPLSLAGLIYWMVVVIGMRVILRKRPTVREGLELPEPTGGWPRLSIIIPAHNEATNIERCVKSLRAQTYPNLELIFVLDRCTDDTLDLLAPHQEADERIKVIQNDSCPDDWSGKCHAVHRGYLEAQGDYLLFADADTEFDSDLARASVALIDHHGNGLLTLLTTLSCRYFFELTAQPVATFRLMISYPPQRRSRRDQLPRSFANGQFMLFSRACYERIGGHEAIKHEVTEDMALARQVDASGDRGLVLLSDGMIRCSMYETMEDFRRGWNRIFIDVCRQRPLRLRRYARRMLVSGLVFPVIQFAMLAVGAALLAGGSALLGGVVLAVVLTGLLIQGAALTIIYPLSGAPAWAAALYPIGCVSVARILFEAASNLDNEVPMEWAGRLYIYEARYTSDRSNLGFREVAG